MNTLLKHWFENALRSRGYELKQIGDPPRGFSGSLEYAKSRGLAPKTVFDVGVGHGTPWLYDAFPKAKLVLFEPLPVFNADVAEIVGRYGADSHQVALSKAPGTADFNMNVGYPTSSSLLTLDPTFAEFAAKVQQEHHFKTQMVKLDTLDNLNKYEPPYVLKLDVEGGERAALEGARETLRKTDFVLIELSVMHRVSGEPSFAEMIGFLDACGFELFDIPSLSQTHKTAQLIYLDAAFVPKHSKLWPG